jgi:hypothetical protein
LARRPHHPRGQQQLECAAQAQRDTEDELLANLTKTQLRRLLLILRERFSAEAETSCTTAGNDTRC